MSDWSERARELLAASATKEAWLSCGTSVFVPHPKGGRWHIGSFDHESDARLAAACPALLAEALVERDQLRERVAALEVSARHADSLLSSTRCTPEVGCARYYLRAVLKESP